MDLKDLQGIGSRRIREDSPAGAAIRNESDFEALQVEMRKLELPAAEQPDWGKVVDTAGAMVRDRSKDLLIMVWLTVALAHRHGAEGLRVGLAEIRDAATGFWETCYPELRRVRARVAAMDWLAERGSRAIARFNLSPALTAPLDECVAIVEALDAFFREKVEEGWGGLGELRSALNEARSRIARPAAPAESAAGAAPAGAGAGVPAAAGGAGLSTAGIAAPLPPGAPSTPVEAQRQLQQIRDAGARLAQYLRAADSKDPLPYRLLRALAWAHLAQLPPNNNGQTEIPQYQPPELGRTLKDAAAQGQWTGILEQTEERFRTNILWLDLHRYAAEALEALGAPDAAEAVAVELAGLLRRLPGLEQLRFAGGEPLADEGTRRWIREKVMPQGQEGAGARSEPARTAATAGPLPVEAGAELEGMAQVVEKARALARRKQLPEAVRLLEERAAGCRQLRSRAMWRVEVGKLCLQSGRASTAYAQLRALDEELRAAGPEAWDAELGLELAKTLFLSHQAALSSSRTPTPEEVTVTQELWGRLCRIDPSAAATLEGKP
jgi:type VI secretion system protein VasJ